MDIIYPNQVWVADITYVRLGQGHIYLAVIMDVYTRTIRGWQYACTDYVQLLTEKRVQISMAKVGEPRENGYAERLMRTLKEEEIDLSEYFDFSEAYQRIGHFIEAVYNIKRIHSSLGYLTPCAFEQYYHQQQVQFIH